MSLDAAVAWGKADNWVFAAVDCPVARTSGIREVAVAVGGVECIGCLVPRDAEVGDILG